LIFHLVADWNLPVKFMASKTSPATTQFNKCPKIKLHWSRQLILENPEQGIHGIIGMRGKLSLAVCWYSKEEA